jgi:hypothetical protein
MLLSFQRSFQLFRDVDCVVSNGERNHDLHEERNGQFDSDIIDSLLDDFSQDFSLILDCLNLNEMKKHIINCIASLIHITKKVELRSKLSKLKKRKENIENTVFVAAVTMAAQVLTNGNGKQTMSIDNYTFPDKTSIGWSPLAWAVVSDLKEEDIKCIYLADPIALGRHHLDVEDLIDKDFIGYSPAHMLCMQTNPSLSLIRFLVGTIQ